MARKTNFETLAPNRVVKVRAERIARGSLWPIPPGAVTAGVDLQQDEQGRIYLTRKSRDGFVQGYRLLGEDGRQLRVSRSYRP